MFFHCAFIQILYSNYEFNRDIVFGAVRSLKKQTNGANCVVISKRCVYLHHVSPKAMMVGAALEYKIVVYHESQPVISFVMMFSTPRPPDF